MSHERKWTQRCEAGAELVEWIVVTLILILAIFAILQVIGNDVEQLFDQIQGFVSGLGL